MLSKILIPKSNRQNVHAPYVNLAQRHGRTVDFVPFVNIVPISVTHFRKYKSVIMNHTAFLFTNKIAIDYFFELCAASKIKPSEKNKYFCTSEQLSHYLQKYVPIRKRKVFSGRARVEDLFDLFKKHKEERFLFPCSSLRRPAISRFFRQNKIAYTEIITYEILEQDLSGLDSQAYEVIAFFSPMEVKSFRKNFPSFDPAGTQIAGWGPQTAKAIKAAGWQVDIQAPKAGARSLVDALNLHFNKHKLAAPEKKG